MVVDTHPGANPLTDGAMQVADLVVVPVVLGAREMDALEAIVADYAGYNLLLVPTMVPAGAHRDASSSGSRRSPAAGSRSRLPVSEHRWIRRRLRRAALVTQPNPGVRVRAAAAEFRAVADSVEVACG